MGKPKQERRPVRDTNIVVFTGNLTREVKRRGKTAVFGLAVHTVERMDGEKIEVPFFPEVTVFEPSATACIDHLKKGRKVLIEGSLTFDEYEAQYDDGKTIYRDEAQAEPVMKLVPRILTGNVQFI